MPNIPNRHKVILWLSLPIIGGMISQNILNLVDTAMVGQLGSESLASVGLGSFVNFACGAFVMGMAVGVQALVAYMRGAGNQNFTTPLNAGLLLSLIFSIPLTILFSTTAPYIMETLSEQLGIQEQGSIYLQARLLGMTALGVNFCFRSYLSAIEKTGLYLITLLIMHMTNIFLNWVLIFGHLGFSPMGVEGAGLGTSISLWLGALIYFIYACMYFVKDGFLIRLPSKEQWKLLLQYSLSSGIERVFFALGMTTFITFIGWMGVVELAVSNVILNLFLVAILPAMGFGIAASTLVARSLGAQRIDEIQIWQKNVTLWALAILCSIALLFILYPHWICSQFLQDPMAINMGVEVVQFMVFFLPFEALHMVMYQSLLGIGSHGFVMKVTFCLQWFVSLPLVYLVGPYLGWGILATWGIHFGTRVLMFLVYRQRWKSQMKHLKLSNQDNLKHALI